MSKFIRHTILSTALALTASAAFAQVVAKPAPAPTAVEVYKGTIDYFDVYGYGKEGGFSSCMEKGRFAVEGSFENFLKALRAIKPNRATTAYSVNEVTLCTYPTNTLP